MSPFVDGEHRRATRFDAIVRRRLRRRSAIPPSCPLVQLGDDDWLLELFHGPTLAFKDVALQLVGRLFDHVLGRAGRAGHDRRAPRRATPARPPSTPCGAARHVDIVVLYPDGRVSDVQRRQMTTVDAPNVHTVAVEGTFDDCQDLVKAMFADDAVPRPACSCRRSTRSTGPG